MLIAKVRRKFHLAKCFSINKKFATGIYSSCNFGAFFFLFGNLFVSLQRENKDQIFGADVFAGLGDKGRKGAGWIATERGDVSAEER